MEKIIKRIIAEELGCEIDEVLPNKFLIEDLGMDNFDRIELAMHIEDELGVDIPNSAEIETVQDVIDFVEKASKE